MENAQDRREPPWAAVHFANTCPIVTEDGMGGRKEGTRPRTDEKGWNLMGEI